MMGRYCQKQSPEVICKRYPEKFRKSYKKTPTSKSLFYRVKDLLKSGFNTGAFL